MNRVIKRMATIAGIGMFAVILSVSVTFLSAQKENSEFYLLKQNIEVLAQSEQSGYKGDCKNKKDGCTGECPGCKAPLTVEDANVKGPLENMKGTCVKCNYTI